jgi:hypothetical protein
LGAERSVDLLHRKADLSIRSIRDPFSNFTDLSDGQNLNLFSHKTATDNGI